MKSRILTLFTRSSRDQLDEVNGRLAHSVKCESGQFDVSVGGGEARGSSCAGALCAVLRYGARGAGSFGGGLGRTRRRASDMRSLARKPFLWSSGEWSYLSGFSSPLTPSEAHALAVVTRCLSGAHGERGLSWRKSTSGHTPTKPVTISR